MTTILQNQTVIMNDLAQIKAAMPQLANCAFGAVQVYATVVAPEAVSAVQTWGNQFSAWVNQTVSSSG